MSHAKSVRTEVEVFLDDLDLTDEIAEAVGERIDGGVQQVFHRLGPVAERNCDWFKCMEEPWKSLADVLHFGKQW